MTFPIDNSTLVVMAYAVETVEVPTESLTPVTGSSFERVIAPRASDRSDYEFCPRCALVVSAGQLSTHLTACSGVT